MSTSFEDAVKRAYTIASERRHELVTLEHLLASLVEISEIQEIIENVGGNLSILQQELALYLDDSSNHIIVKSIGYQPRHTGLLLQVIKKAKTQSLFLNKPDMICVDLFLAMFNIENSHASYFLHKAGLEKDAVLNYIHGQKNNSAGGDMNATDAENVLYQFCINLNEKAGKGKIDPLIGREVEVDAITQIIARRNKHNVIMVGDPGVGKTIIVEGLAKRIVEGDVPDVLKTKTIWSLDMGSMVAGTKFRGDFEERMKQVIAAFSVLPETIMFIDEIHMIMGAGGGSNGAMDAANLLKPALGRGDIRCIGSTTYDEYRKHFEKDRALGRRFQKIDINEPSIEDTKRILTALAPYYAAYHDITYEPIALDAAVELSVRYIHDKFLPDKAIDVIDSAGARQKIKPTSYRAATIGLEQIKDEVSRIARVPIDVDTVTETDQLEKLETDLKSVVFGQDSAISQLVDAVLISKSGLRESNKTQGAFLFSGPTGVGKTEIAKQLAHTLQIEFIRFDMSEFQEQHSVSRFIGSPPGYIGYSDGSAGSGVLINAIEKTPHCVILCDEIEKAHPDIVNIFLQIMDNGSITSQSGKTANATNVILIFTSNLGASAMEKPVIGFGDSERKDADTAAVNTWFAPEFRNRLDNIIMFNRLNKENMLLILDKFIIQLNALTSAKNVNVVFDAAAKQWLMDQGFDRNMGARPLSRVINKHVKTPLSREMIFGRLKNGGGVMFTMLDGKLHYNVISMPNDHIDIELPNIDMEAINI